MLSLYRSSFKAMGSPCELHFYCESQQHFDEISSLCQQQLALLESKYSRYRCDSLLSQINQAAGTGKTFRLDEECWQLLQYANAAWQISDGLFDITSGVLRKAWDFKNNIIPDQSAIDALLDKVGWERIDLNQHQFRLPMPGMELDFGGIVKEYAADLLVQLAVDNNVAHGLVDLAGDIAIVGPHLDQSPWQIAIKDPLNPQQPIATIPLVSGGLASSGDYERCIIIDEVKYSHILNPKTGWPIQGLAAVSVWAPQCVVAGTLATTAMLLEQGKDFLAASGAQFVAVEQSGEVTSLKI